MYSFQLASTVIWKSQFINHHEKIILDIKLIIVNHVSTKKIGWPFLLSELHLTFMLNKNFDGLVELVKFAAPN